MVDNNPSLNINFQLPNYYTNVQANYGSQCDSLPALTLDAMDCNTNYQTAINYVDECRFELEQDGNDYIYRGSLYISAELDLNVEGYSITRTVSQPLNWQVRLAQQISVSTDIQISNDNVCTNSGANPSPECHSNGCCVDGQCDCTCAGAVKSGYSGDYCEIDNTPPHIV